MSRVGTMHDLEKTIPELQPLQIAFGNTLKAIRMLREMKTSDLAEQSGLSREVVKKIEDGKSNPKLTTIIALAQGLDIDPSCLFEKITAYGEMRNYVAHFALHPPDPFPK